MARKPDYRLKAGLHSADKPLRPVGAAWFNKDASISIVLDPFVVLDGNVPTTLILYPENEDADH